MYKLNLLDFDNNTIEFTDWEKKTVDFLDEHKNIKKVWLVNEARKTGATYFAKLLMFFRPPVSRTFVISNNLDHWSKYISKQMPIKFPILDKETKDSKIYTANDFLTPVTLFGLEKEINDATETNKMLSELSGTDIFTEFECLYDRDFDVKKYKILCTYNFKFFIINVSLKDLEKAKPFIEEDKNKDDVLIVEINDALNPEWWEKNKKYMKNYQNN